MAGLAVVAHENEHVVREQAKASRDGKEVVLQTVQIDAAIESMLSVVEMHLLASSQNRLVERR